MTTPPFYPTASNDELKQLFAFLTEASHVMKDSSPYDRPMKPVPTKVEGFFQRLTVAKDPDACDAKASMHHSRQSSVASTLSDTNIEDITLVDEESDTDAELPKSKAEFAHADTKFEFKHHIYKLYGTEDWLKMVEGEIEASQARYRPLEEQVVVYAGAKEDEGDVLPLGKDDGAVRFKIPVRLPSSSRSRCRSVLSARQRVASIHAGTSPTSAWLQLPTSSSPDRASYPRSPTVEDRPEIHALKKRCVGRRRSMSGLRDHEVEGTLPGAWAYNSAISASEPLPDATLPPIPPAPTIKTDPPNYGALAMKNFPTTLQGTANRNRRVSDRGPRMMKVPRLAPLSRITGNKDRLIARRRARAFDLDAIERFPAERACVI